MRRFTYLIPRVIILALIALAVWMGSDPLIKKNLIESTQQVTGAKVEIEQVRASLSEGKVFLKDLTIADPRNPMTNLVQAEMAYVVLDPQRLMHKEIVIQNGRTSRLMFGVPRTGTGEMPGIPLHLPDNDVRYFPLELPTTTNQLAQRWIDGFESPIVSTSPAQPETIGAASRMQQAWQKQIAQIDDQIARVQAQGNEVVLHLAEKGIEFNQQGFPRNPLRDGPHLRSVGHVAQRLQTETEQLQQAILQLERQGASDLQSIIELKQSELSTFEMARPDVQLDANGLSQLMLNEFCHHHVAEIVDWFRWFRDVIPDPHTEFLRKRERGQRVYFDGATAKPRILIKQLELDGEGHFAGNHLNFTGTAHDFTSEPWLHDQPAKFHLRAQGNQHFIVDCSLDRRGPEWRDELNIQCPSLAIDTQTLGCEETILVTLGDSDLQADVALKMLGDQLDGTITFRHTNVIMHVDSLHNMVGGTDAAIRLNQDIANVTEFQTVVQLSGTLERPQYEFRSDIGEKFANTLNRVIKGEHVDKMANQRQRLEDSLDAEIRELRVYLQENIERLGRLLDSETASVARLKKNLSVDDGARIR